MKIRENFRNIMSTMMILLPKMGRFLAALMCVYYVFSSKSCEVRLGSRKYPNASWDHVNVGSTSPLVIGMTAYANTVSQECNVTTCGGEFADNYASGAGYYQLNNFDNILYRYG